MDKLANTEGSLLLCRICGLEVSVTKGGTGIVRCCGEAMAVIAEPEIAEAGGSSMGLHKRGEAWKCQVCEIEVLVTKEGGSTLSCCGKPMVKKQ